MGKYLFTYFMKRDRKVIFPQIQESSVEHIWQNKTNKLECDPLKLKTFGRQIGFCFFDLLLNLFGRFGAIIECENTIQYC